MTKICQPRLHSLPLLSERESMGSRFLEPISRTPPHTIYRTGRPRNAPPPLFSHRLVTKWQLRRLSCRAHGEEAEEADWVSSPSASPYEILGVDPASCSAEQLKSAYRARVKEFHPDVCKEQRNSEATIRRVIEAYEILLKSHRDKPTTGSCIDPFEEPECEAYDLFVNEVLCAGKGCPYSCVKEAPHAFSFTSKTGTARAVSQGHDDDYHVHLAVGQCPRRCIHYVTPSQRAILEDILDSVLKAPYDLAEAAFLETLISKAAFENKRYQKPKRKPRVSTEHVDWR